MNDEILEAARLHAELELPEKELPFFALEFLESLKRSGRKRTTYIRYSYYIYNFFEWVKKVKKVEEVDLALFTSLESKDYEDYYGYLLYELNQQILSVKRVQSVLHRFTGHFENNSAQAEIIIKNGKKSTNKLDERDFIKSTDFKKLLSVMKSKKGLTENQLKGRDFLINRNVSIACLFYFYGLTVSELNSLKMDQVILGTNRTIQVGGDRPRTLELRKEDAILLHSYLSDVPAEVRPENGSKDPLFVSFDYQRLTYRWVYGENGAEGKPKALSRLAVQKMIQQEARRSGIHATAQKMRNTAILRCLAEEKYTDIQILERFGLKSQNTLRRYTDFLQTLQESDSNDDYSI